MAPARLAVLSLAAVAAACSPPPGVYVPTAQDAAGSETLVPDDGVRTRPRADRLTEEEVEAARRSGRSGNAHLLVHRLRPRWLAGDRGTESLNPRRFGQQRVHVWYNGRHLGAAEEVLASIDISSIISLRYLDPISARATYGGEYGRGVILITGR